MSTTTNGTPPAANKAPGKPRRRGKKSTDDGSKKSVSGENASSTTGLSTPIDATNNATQPGEILELVKFDKLERESTKDVAKRVKRQAKKLENIKRSEDKIKDLGDDEKVTTKLINADERRKLQDKPITLAVHRELQEVHDKLKELAEVEDKALEGRLEQQKKHYEAKLASAVKQAKEEGLSQGHQEKANEGNEKVNTLLKFLRLAGYRRSFKSENTQEDDAIEQVLVLVYSGDSSAMNTCMKLAEGSLEPVGDEHTVSYARVKELAHELRIDDDEDVEETTSEEIPTQAGLIEGSISAPTEETEPTIVPQQVLVDVAEPKAVTSVPVVASAAEEASNQNGNSTDPAHQELTSGWVKISNKDAEAPIVEEGAALTESTGNAQLIPGPEKPADGEFQSVEHKRGGKSGRGMYRGRSDFRGGYRGRGFRGDRGGEHRGRGGPRGGRGFRSNKNDNQPAPVSQAAPVATSS